jgi:MFS family permease
MSLHYAAEAVTVLQWSQLSDHIGRKPVLLLGLLGTVMSTILFGLSRSFWALILRFAAFLSTSLVDFLISIAVAA